MLKLYNHLTTITGAASDLTEEYAAQWIEELNASSEYRVQSAVFKADTTATRAEEELYNARLSRDAIKARYESALNGEPPAVDPDFNIPNQDTEYDDPFSFMYTAP